MCNRILIPMLSFETIIFFIMKVGACMCFLFSSCPSYVCRPYHRSNLQPTVKPRASNNGSPLAILHVSCTRGGHSLAQATPSMDPQVRAHAAAFQFQFHHDTAPHRRPSPTRQHLAWARGGPSLVTISQAHTSSSSSRVPGTPFFSQKRK